MRARAFRSSIFAAVSALALAACETAPTPEQIHARDWDMTARSDWPGAYENYLRIWPNGVNAPIARARIEQLNAADAAAFREARRVDTELAYVEYLARYPWSPNTAEAQSLRDLRAAPRLAAEEKAEFDSAVAARSIDQWEAFLVRWPSGANAETARARLDALWRTDQGAFVRARRTGSPAELDAFIRANPRSTYVADAWRELDLIRLRDNEAWRIALAQDSVPGYDRYLAENPWGEWRAEAQRSIQVLRDRDFAAWQYARQMDTIWGYEAYRSQYPWGGWHNDAWIRIDWLRARERDYDRGWNYNDRDRDGRDRDDRDRNDRDPPRGGGDNGGGRPVGGNPNTGRDPGRPDADPGRPNPPRGGGDNNGGGRPSSPSPLSPPPPPPPPAPPSPSAAPPSPPPAPPPAPPPPSHRATGLSEQGVKVDD